MIFLSFSIFLLILYVWLIFYYRKGWKSLVEFEVSQEVNESSLPFISVIIAARNEEKNIGACVRSILNQTYPSTKFELIITDDHSTDKTVEVIHSFKDERMRVLHLSDFAEARELNSHKKKSIETALGFAKGELIVTTDADCITQKKWLETLANFYVKESPVFVAMPVKFENPKASDSFFKRVFKIFQFLDFMSLQGITAASVFKRNFAMCNGANLAYTKEAFFEVEGFKDIDQLASGDDMLLMQKIQKKYPNETVFLKSKEVIVSTKPAENLKEFFSQRIRWASKTNSYTNKKIILVLLLVYCLNAWLLLLGVFSFFNLNLFYLFIISLLLKTFVELLFLFPVARFFGNQKLLSWFLPSQPFHIIYTVIAGWLGKFGSYQWKGRKVK